MRILLLIFGIILHNTQVHANEDFVWNGVLTQAVFHTDHNNVYGKSEDDISFDFTEFSLNASYNLPKSFRVSGQIIYRHAGAGFDGADLDYLMLDHQFIARDRYNAGFRVGRVKIPFGIYNDSRDVLLTRPSIYLSQGVYYDLTLRETLLSGDGVYLYGNYFSRHGHWNAELGYGKALDDNLENLSDLTSVEHGAIYRIQYASHQQILISFSGFYSDTITSSSEININQIVPGFPIPSSVLNLTSDIVGRYNFLSFSFPHGGWEFIAEYGFIDVEATDVNISGNSLVLSSIPTNLLGQNANAINRTSQAYYVMLKKHISRYWEMYFGHDVYYVDKDDRDGGLFEQQGRGLAYSRFAKDSSVGVRWYPKRNMLISAEYHYVDGSGWLNLSENPDFQQSSTRYWNILTAALSYRF
jgi:hypothetical protein